MIDELLFLEGNVDVAGNRKRLALVAVCILSVSSAHWWAPRDSMTDHITHVLLRKMYLLPIVLAAVWFTLRGALLTALAVTVLYLPHVILQWSGESAENINQVGEVATLWATAVIAGVVVQREKQAMRQRTRTYQGAVRALVGALDAREHDTELHSERVCAYSLRISTELGIDDNARRALALGALLHDIGKIGIPDEILLKPGALTEEEWTYMRRHPELGAGILAPVPFLTEAMDVVANHHERFDGTGYPRGLREAEIPVGARIFAVADVFDALTSARPYRKPMLWSDARAEIQRSSGGHFDPWVVDAFLRVPAQEWPQLARSIEGNSSALMQPGVVEAATSA